MVLTPVAFNSIWGLDTFTWFAKTHELTKGSHLSIGLPSGPAFPDVSYAYLTIRDPASILVTGESGPAEDVAIEQIVGDSWQVSQARFKAGQWYIFPEGHYRLGLKRSYDEKSPAIDALTLQLEQRDIPAAEELTKLEEVAQPIAITLRPHEGGLWRGEFSIASAVVPAGPFRPVVKFTGFGSSSTLFEDLHEDGSKLYASQSLDDLRMRVNEVTTLLWFNPQVFTRSPSAYPKLNPSGWTLGIEGKATPETSGQQSASPDVIVLYALLGAEKTRPATSNSSGFRPSSSTAFSLPAFPDSPQELVKQAEAKARQAGSSLNHKQSWEEVAKLYRGAIHGGGEGIEIHCEARTSSARAGRPRLRDRGGADRTGAVEQRPEPDQHPGLVSLSGRPVWRGTPAGPRGGDEVAFLGISRHAGACRIRSLKLERGRTRLETCPRRQTEVF